MRLYRDKENAILGGVCAGIARETNIDVAIIRLLVVIAVFTSIGMGILVYLAACLIIDPLPDNIYAYYAASGDEDLSMQGRTPVQTLDYIEKLLIKDEAKVQHLEAYLTSNNFKTDSEFSKL